ncbi:organic cation transporter-like protein [Strongylocentrotus purpuratus]|uniref:Major facilitator superfamily (MFS) profile domain-containing protein n=1 Tax=Strongylocentrotus purpuratus TaxID=7668 RepID=A0A7M7MZC1_STRPU|nr:organic cation transporter-like protein [Strongylocentrotus purpuratus]
MGFDDFLPTLGEFGTYQKIICALVSTFQFPAVTSVLAIVFLATPANLWCSFDLICDRKYLINLSQSLFFVGVLIGCVTFGAIADRFGRKVTLILCNIIFVLIGIGAAFSPNYITFVVMRTIEAAACFGFALISYVIDFLVFLSSGTEFVGPSKRAFVSVMLTAAFPLGYILLTFYAYFINNWRHLLLALHLTFAIYFFFYLKLEFSLKQHCLLVRTVIFYFLHVDDFSFIPESVRWQISKGRYKEAQATVKRVAKINKVKLTDDFFYQHNFYRTRETTNPERNHDPNLIDLFRTPVLRKRMIVLIIVWMTNNLIFYGLHLSTGSFGVNIYLSFLISAVVEIVAMIICILVIEQVGRRYSLIACLAISGIASCIAIFIPTPLMLLLYDVWPPGSLVLQTIAALVTAALCLILPETRGKKLPETLEDGETFGM